MTKEEIKKQIADKESELAALRAQLAAASKSYGEREAERLVTRGDSEFIEFWNHRKTDFVGIRHITADTCIPFHGALQRSLAEILDAAHAAGKQEGREEMKREAVEAAKAAADQFHERAFAGPLTAAQEVVSAIESL